MAEMNKDGGPVSTNGGSSGQGDGNGKRSVLTALKEQSKVVKERAAERR